ncbi:Ubiquitin-conjugating enzyme [Paragonimus heterotremus]|uniref:Ubiquitin-conjugating enzyme n=2 Tax=Paragonimus TaxID=34503 RepID=A0A8J4TBL0_9TREM|nr:Ubiquitin-conjugating enzyme [Paragonimus heterotremus]
MTSIAAKRIQKELAELLRSDEVAQNQIEIRPSGDDLMRLEGLIKGPPETPYSGAKFNLEIIIPTNYPFVPPKVKFLTRIWHPNISSATGVICLDVLKDQWAAAMSLRTVLLSIQALLASPEPDDPQDAVVATQFKSNPEAFVRTAQYWAAVYADGPFRDTGCDSLVERLVLMGFDEHESRCALSMKNWDLTLATEHLLK